jgi:Arc/MetJ family transcription regulator
MHVYSVAIIAPLRDNFNPMLSHGVDVEPHAKMCDNVCGGSHMATNLSIDPDLLDRAVAVSGERTKKATVTKALQEFIARRRQKHLLELMGQLEWGEGFDYKAERSRR